MTKVTAIVSAYYAADFLEARLENLRGVDTIVVCQDKSNEASIAANFDVTVITTPDIPTVYAAWNMAIKAAKGDYIISANSDDEIYAGGVKVLQDALDEYQDYALAYFDVDRVEDGEKIGVFEWAEGGFDDLMHGCFIGPMPMWRKSLHDKYGYFDEGLTVAGDYDFWLRIAKGGEKFYHVRSIWGAHAERKDALEHRAPVRTLWETAQVRGRYRDNEENHDD